MGLLKNDLQCCLNWITLIYLFLQNMDIPECENHITYIYKKQGEMRKIGEVHKKKRNKYTIMTENVIRKGS